GLRSGDTPADERRSLARTPPDVLITTPESLFLLLTSQARASLTGVETIILDEVHALAGSKRGAHLALSLERLDALLPQPAQRSASPRRYGQWRTSPDGSAVRATCPSASCSRRRARCSTCRSSSRCPTWRSLMRVFPGARA